MRRALEVLAATSARRRIAVLGEMLELGDHAASLHAECGRAAAATRLRQLFAIGGAPAAALAQAAVEAGMPAADVHYFVSSPEAAATVSAAVRPGDAVLVKGSRGIRCDVVVDRLVQDHG